MERKPTYAKRILNALVRSGNESVHRDGQLKPHDAHVSDFSSTNCGHPPAHHGRDWSVPLRIGSTQPPPRPILVGVRTTAALCMALFAVTLALVDDEL